MLCLGGCLFRFSEVSRYRDVLQSRIAQRVSTGSQYTVVVFSSVKVQEGCRSFMFRVKKVTG